MKSRTSIVVQISESYKEPEPIIFHISYSEPNYDFHKAHGQVVWFNGSLANGAWKEQLSGALRTEPATAIIPCNNCYSGEFLTAATTETRTDMCSCAKFC